jgi:hypothetical protein
VIDDDDPRSTVNRLQIPANNEGRLRGTSYSSYLIMPKTLTSRQATSKYDLITSWVFLHKHIAHAEDGNGRIVERKVLWKSESTLIGKHFLKNFSLDDGDYRGTSPELLCKFANRCLENFGDTARREERTSLLEIKQLLAGACETDNYFVSSDIQRCLGVEYLGDLKGFKHLPL